MLFFQVFFLFKHINHCLPPKHLGFNFSNILITLKCYLDSSEDEIGGMLVCFLLYILRWLSRPRLRFPENFTDMAAGIPNEPNQPKAVKSVFKYLMLFEACLLPLARWIWSVRIP